MATNRKITVRDNALVLSQHTDVYNTADANLQKWADAQLVRLHEEWIETELVRWDLDDLPLRAENAVTDLLAYKLSTHNESIKPSVRAEIQRNAAIAEINLQRQAEIPYSGAPVQADYF